MFHLLSHSDTKYTVEIHQIVSLIVYKVVKMSLTNTNRRTDTLGILEVVCLSESSSYLIEGQCIYKSINQTEILSLVFKFLNSICILNTNFLLFISFLHQI